MSTSRTRATVRHRVVRPRRPPSGICQFCRCTDMNGCPEGCSWANRSHTVCTMETCVDLARKRHMRLLPNIEITEIGF